MRRDYWKEGDFNAICDSCGFKFKASELRERYDGMMVCAQDWEARHPLERSFAIRNPASLQWTRPESQDTFVGHLFCTVDGMNGTTDHGTTDCARTDRNTTQGQ